LYDVVERIGRWLSFFFQAEDGIRDWSVTGVQTCALPIFEPLVQLASPVITPSNQGAAIAGDASWTSGSITFHEGGGCTEADLIQIGRASCRERVATDGECDSWSKKSQWRSR